MTIGLVGEAPYDTDSVKNLLDKIYPERFDFITLLNNFKGSLLDSQKTKRFLRTEYESFNPDVVIFIRDLDGLETDKAQMAVRRGYFTNSNSVVDKKGIFMLHIFEIEALLLADIETFNAHYSVSLDYNEDPMLKTKPKEFLKEQTKYKYDDSHNPELFSQLNPETLKNRCKYFNRYLERFDKIVNN